MVKHDDTDISDEEFEARLRERLKNLTPAEWLELKLWFFEAAKFMKWYDRYMGQLANESPEHAEPKLESWASIRRVNPVPGRLFHGKK